MQSTGHILITTSGNAIDLSEIRRVDSLSWGNESVSFMLYYKGIDSSSYVTMEYEYIKFEGTKEEIRERVENIRHEIITIMNGGIPPVHITSGLKMKNNGK